MERKFNYQLLTKLWQNSSIMETILHEFSPHFHYL